MELKLQNIQIAEREVDRQKLELNATIREQADARKYQIERRRRCRQIPRRAGGRGRKRLSREQIAEAVKAEGLAQAAAEAALRREVGLADGRRDPGPR